MTTMPGSGCYTVALEGSYICTWDGEQIYILVLFLRFEEVHSSTIYSTIVVIIQPLSFL